MIYIIIGVFGLILLLLVRFVNIEVKKCTYSEKEIVNFISGQFHFNSDSRYVRRREKISLRDLLIVTSITVVVPALIIFHFTTICIFISYLVTNKEFLDIKLF